MVSVLCGCWQGARAIFVGAAARSASQEVLGWTFSEFGRLFAGCVGKKGSSWHGNATPDRKQEETWLVGPSIVRVLLGMGGSFGASTRFMRDIEVRLLSTADSSFLSSKYLALQVFRLVS